METLKNYTLLGCTYLSQWRMQTFRWEGGGGRSSTPFDKGGPVSNFFSALWASVWSKDKGGGGAALDPPLYLAHIWEYLGIWTYDLVHFRGML